MAPSRPFASGPTGSAPVPVAVLRFPSSFVGRDSRSSSGGFDFSLTGPLKPPWGPSSRFLYYERPFNDNSLLGVALRLVLGPRGEVQMIVERPPFKLSSFEGAMECRRGMVPL